MTEVVKLVRLDASRWRKPLDFYEGLLASLGAPEGHGRNLNALIDSMIYGGINRLEPPYKIVIVGTHAVPGAVAEEIKLVKKYLYEAQGKDVNDLQVVIDLLP